MNQTARSLAAVFIPPMPCSFLQVSRAARREIVDAIAVEFARLMTV
jgi:hypothetical protein